MIIAIFAYILTIFLVFYKIKKNKYKTKPLPKLKINKNGIIFYSNEKHKIKLDNVKLLVIEYTAYLKSDNQIVTIHNVEDVFFYEGYLYFKAKGDVKILFATAEIYRYFNLIIQAKKFNLNKLKQLALIDVLNNVFNITNSKILKKYLNIVKNILKININNKKIEIKPNSFNLSYTLIYKTNNCITKVKVEETLWQISSFLV